MRQIDSLIRFIPILVLFLFHQYSIPALGQEADLSGWMLPKGKYKAWNMKFQLYDRYAQEPANDLRGNSWKDLSYDDSSWESLAGPLGRYASDTINSNYSWEGDNKTFYLRRILNLSSVPSDDVVLHLLLDDAVEVYINGSLVTEVTGYKVVWLTYPINPNVFVKGKNILAIKYTTVYRPDYLDYGIYGGTEVKEDDFPKLNISASKTTLSEGDTFTLTVKADSVPTEAATLMLTCDNSVRFDFPSKLVLPAGESTVSTTVTVIDNHDIADTQSAAFTVSAENYESGEAIVLVNDDDMPHIELVLAPTAVSTNSGTNAVMGTIKRNDNLNSKVTVVLSDDTDDLLSYSPSQVALERGATEAHFTISPKSAVSTDQEVNITAAVYVKTCDCPAGAQSGGSTTQKLTLLAGEGAALDIKPLATDFSLDSNDNGIVITIESPLQENLTVNVTSNFDDYLDYPHAVEILAGDSSVSIPVKKKGKGGISEGQVITFTASATGYATAACWMIATENSLPDAVITSLEVSATEAEAGSEVELTLVVKNIGSGLLSEGTPVKLVLSDKSYPVMLKTGASLSSGESTTMTTNYELPLLTGIYSFQAIVNPSGRVEEAVTINNMSQEIPIVITPNYQVTAITDKTEYAQGEVITVTGKATGTKSAFADVEVYFVNDGMRQTVKAKTDSEGNYMALFLPIDGTAGHFSVGACFPGEEKTEAMVEVYVYGLKLESYRTTCKVVQNGTYSGSIAVSNPCDRPQTNIRVVQQDSPTGCEFSFTDNIDIAAGDTVDIPFTINAGSEVTAGMNRMYLSVRSDQDALVEHTVDYSIEPAKGCLKTDSTSISMTMTLGQAREFPLTVWNEGMGPTGAISLTLPTWIQSVTPQQLPPLAPGDSLTVILRLMPTDDMYLKGRIGMNCAEGTGLSVGIEVTSVSDQTGTITIDVVDEFTWCTEEKPHVSGAKVQVLNRANGAIVAEGFTNDEGKFTFDVLGGWYRLKVSADYHETYDGMLLVDPGMSRAKRIFISFNGITTEWNVEETEVEDEYSMETVLKFETMVPPPYIEVIWPEEKPVPGKYFPVTLVNKGLLKFYDVKANLSVSSGIYGIELMGNSERDTINAGESVILYARLTTGNTQQAKAVVTNGCLEISADVECCYDCVTQVNKNYKTKKKWGQCSGSSGGSGSSGHSGGSDNSNDHHDNDDPTEEDDFACELPKFKIVTVNTNEKILGAATDGKSQVKIVLDGDYSETVSGITWSIEGNVDNKFGMLENEDQLSGVLYTAPDNYPEDNTSSFKVYANLTCTIWGEEKHINHAVEIELIRVPVVMVHGLNSSRHCWDSMKDYLKKNHYKNLLALDYSITNKNKFEENKSVVYDKGIRYFLESEYFTKQYVASKVDIVAHSMGGLLTKLFLKNNPDYRERINKFITINTPHGGSQLGNFMTDSKINFIHEIEIRDDSYSTGNKTLSNPIVRLLINELFNTFNPTCDNCDPPLTMKDGAVADLSVGGNAIDVLNDATITEGVKCHAIVTSGNGKKEWNTVETIARRASEAKQLQFIYETIHNELGYNDEDALMTDIFDGPNNRDGRNDMVVSELSQMGGIVNISWFPQNPSDRPGNISFAHTESCKNEIIQQEVLRLLNSDKESDFSRGFGRTPELQYEMSNMTWEQILREFPFGVMANGDELFDRYVSNDPSVENSSELYVRWLNNNWEDGRNSKIMNSRTPGTKSTLTLSCDYVEGDTLIKIKVIPNGDFSKILFGCIYDNHMFAISRSAEKTVRLPNKVQGDLVIICEGQCEDGTSCAIADTITINTIGNTTMQKLSFMEDSVLILEDEYYSPSVFCTWSDGVVTEVENPTLTVTNGNLAYIEDNKYVYGKNTGHTTLNAYYGNMSCSTPLEVFITQDANANGGNGDDDSSNSVCSISSISLSNKSVMTRQAFRGTLTINNNHPSLPLQNLKLHVEVRDEDGTLATQREFQISLEALNGDFEGELDFDSGWSLNSGSTGVASILFIPTKHAAPTEPKRWYFGGTLSYTDPFTGLVFTNTLKPVALKVNPTPVLDFTYFVQRDVVSDYPWTDNIVEPSVPAEFALLINNKGNADAINLRFISKRPQIENDNGLKIDFSLQNAQLNGEDKALSMSDDVPIEVGTVPAQSQAYLQWWMKTSVLGHFVEYDVSFDHMTSYGNEELSLIDEVNIHKLIHGFTPPQLDSAVSPAEESSTPGRAFLVVDDNESREVIPDRIYFTDATQQEVTEATTATISRQNGNNYLFTVMPYKPGWTYALIDSSVGKDMQVAQITRSDGTTIPADNIWLTGISFKDGEDPIIENKLHFIGDVPEGGEQYMVTFEYKPSDELVVESYEGVPDEDVELEEALTEITVHFNKPISEETFTVDDLSLFLEGTAVDMSTVSISRIDDQTFRLNLGTATSQGGYYVLMVNTQTITDSEGFEGTISKEATWVQKKVVEGFILGDVNGNGQVDIGDAVSIVNRLVGKESNTFVEEAADTNKNGQIDLGDVMTIVNYLMGKTASFSRQQIE